AKVALIAIDPGAQEQRLVDHYFISTLFRPGIAAFSVVGSVCRPRQLSQRPGIVDEQHRRYAFSRLISAADLDGAAKELFGFYWPSGKMQGQGPVIEEGTGVFRIVATQRAHQCEGLFESRDSFTILASRAIRLRQCHESTQIGRF